MVLASSRLLSVDLQPWASSCHSSQTSWVALLKCWFSWLQPTLTAHPPTAPNHLFLKGFLPVFPPSTILPPGCRSSHTSGLVTELLEGNLGAPNSVPSTCPSPVESVHTTVEVVNAMQTVSALRLGASEHRLCYFSMGAISRTPWSLEKCCSR